MSQRTEYRRELRAIARQHKALNRGLVKTEARLVKEIASLQRQIAGNRLATQKLTHHLDRRRAILEGRLR